MFSALWSGKVLVVPRDETRRGAAELVRWFAEYEVGELFAPMPMVEAAYRTVENEGRVRNGGRWP